jgi:hypothetical protein
VPVNQRKWITAFCDTRPEWRDRAAHILSDKGLPTVDIAGLGRELFDDVRRGKRAAELKAAFSCIEMGLAQGDDHTRNLIVVGLFESLQNRAYADLEPPDAMDAWLGPASRDAWADLIEGWTGRGIRSIEHWRRVLVNGPYDWVRWHNAGQEIEWRRDSREHPHPWLSGNHELVGQAFCPLVATSIVREIDSMPGHNSGRTVEVASGTGPESTRIDVGVILYDASGRYVEVDGRIGIVKGDEAEAVWPLALFAP